MGQDDTTTSGKAGSNDSCLAKEFEEMWKEVGSTIKTDDQLQTILQVHDVRDLQNLIGRVSRDVKGSKVGRGRLQSVGVLLSRILETYTGIGDIVKSLNMTTAHAGPLAYGIFAILLKTCQNKRDREDSIKKALEKIELCLYTVPRYREIYDEFVNEILTGRIVEVYKAIYRFVIDSYKYYASPLKRFKNSWTSSKFNTEVLIDDIKAALKALNDQTTTLLHERIKTMRIAITRMEKHARDNDEQTWNDFVSRMQNHFNAPYHINTSCKRTSGNPLAESTDDELEESCDTPEIGNLKALSDRREFREWSMSLRSSLLLIRAINHHDASCHAPLWLSQGAHEYVQYLQQSSDRVIHHIVENDEEHPSAAFGSIMCRIMSWDYQFYTEHKQEVVNFMERPQSADDNFCLQIELATNLLAAWGEYSQRSVFIVLERGERWVQMPRTRVPDHFKAVMKGFKRILESKCAIVKTCMLVDDTFWHKHIKEEVAACGLRDRMIDTGRWQQGLADY